MSGILRSFECYGRLRHAELIRFLVFFLAFWLELFRILFAGGSSGAGREKEMKKYALVVLKEITSAFCF